MNKIKLLFDATVIGYNIDNGTNGRSGIFWTAYNVLQQFKQCSAYEVTLLYTIDPRKPKTGNILSLFPYIVYPWERFEFDCKSRIETHREKIEKNRNVLFICMLRLKIARKQFQLFRIRAKKRRMINKLSNFDVYFSPFSSIPHLMRINRKTKIFQILYDCIPVLDDIPYETGIEKNHPFIQVFKNLDKGTYYFCISQCTKNDFYKSAGSNLDETKMFVTPIAASQVFSPNYNKTILESVLKKYNAALRPGDQYIFSLCSIDPRKNLLFTIKCFVTFIKKHRIDTMYFLLGGGYFKTYIDEFMREIANLGGYRDKVVKLGYVDDEDVNILYSNSLFFAYLPQYEGFGMPPLEAMRSGTPVICSNNSSLPEVVGDAAVTIPCNDEEACIKAFEDLYFNESLRAEYINRGLERAKLFSWENTFAKMNEVIVKTTGKTQR